MASYERRFESFRGAEDVCELHAACTQQHLTGLLDCHEQSPVRELNMVGILDGHPASHDVEDLKPVCPQLICHVFGSIDAVDIADEFSRIQYPGRNRLIMTILRACVINSI